MPQPLLPRMYREQQKIAALQAVAQAILESGGEVELPEPRAGATPVGDWQRLRGLPAIGRGVSGAIPGTNPVAEVLRRESRRR